MTHEFYTVQYALKMRVLPFLLNYTFSLDTCSLTHIINLGSYNSAWKVFADTETNVAEFRLNGQVQGKNVELTGYGKMDALAQFKPRPRDRKKIIIAPHHSIMLDGYFPVGNFLEYAPFFLELPRLYPDIDFIFRPHPALFDKLYGDRFWTIEEINSYIGKMSNIPNVEYQSGGDYLETFVDSDALIHDCGSFIAEYLYTGKPVCYMVKNRDNLSHIFTKLALGCLGQHELAYTTGEIINFIDEVVVKGIDLKKKERIDFADKYIKINYPHASNKILEHIKQELS